MGLLDQLNEVLIQQPRKYWGDKATRLGSLLSDSAAMYGSANSPIAQEHANTLAGLLADFTPVVGDVKSAYDGMNAAREGDYLGAALGGLGALPLVPNLAGMVKGAGLSAQEALEAAKKLTPDAKRVVNPEVWDDSLGGAAWYDRRTPGVYHAIHMTDDPSRAGKAIKSGMDVKESYAAGDAMAQMNSEMGKGLYVSGREDMWKHRGSKKIPVSMVGDFLELERYPYSNSDALQALGFDGAFIRGGMGGVPQTVIWNNDAIKSFGKFSR